MSHCSAWSPTAGPSLTYCPYVHRGSIDVPDQYLWRPVPSRDHVGSVVRNSSSLIQGTGKACVCVDQVGVRSSWRSHVIGSGVETVTTLDQSSTAMLSGTLAIDCAKAYRSHRA